MTAFPWSASWKPRLASVERRELSIMCQMTAWVSATNFGTSPLFFVKSRSPHFPPDLGDILFGNIQSLAEPTKLNRPDASDRDDLEGFPVRIDLHLVAGLKPQLRHLLRGDGDCHGVSDF